MIPVQTLHKELNQRLNRVATNNAGTYTVPDKDSFINNAIQIWQENITGLAETNSRIREDLRNLLFSDKEISLVSSGQEYNTYSYPDDFYRRLRIYAKADYKECPIRRIKTKVIQRDDLEEVIDNPFHNSSFLWASTFCVESNKGIEVYHQNKMNLKGVYIDYYKEIPRVYSPSLLKQGTYYDVKGNTVTKDQGLELCNNSQMRKILDIAALLARVARGDSIEFRLELEKILRVEKLHLN